jgi:hypothetical protein
MGSIGKKVKKTVKKVAKPEVILPLALLAATGGGSAALGAFKGAGLKNILMNQAITAGLSKATTGEIDPKAQLLALGMSGLAGAAKPFTGAESIKQFGASTGLSKDASAALAQKLATNPAYVAPQTGLASMFDKGAQFAKAGFADPLSLKGAVTYGLPTAAGAMMGSPKTEEQKNLGVDPQAQYDLARLMNQKMGGAYTDEELNTLVAPMLSQYGGEYETITGPEKERRPMFPGLNYSGLTRFAKDGGSIKPKKRSEAVDEIVNAAEQREIILDALFGGVSPGANEEAMANQMFDLRRRQRLNPMGRKDGGLMQLASAPDPMDERNTMMENLALDKFGKSLDRLSDDEIIQIEDMIENMLPMANGGSIPQTKSIPAGMQLNGRGGGFIPMGAQEKKDDVPAMLAKNEFVMTSDAVKAAGGGDINKGAQKMYDLMNSLESKV